MNRRILIVIGIVGLAILLVAGVGVALAFSHNNSTSTTATSATPTTTTNGTTTTTKPRVVTAIIQSLGNQTITLSGPHLKKAATVAVDGSTKYGSLDGTVSSFSDLKVGQTVRVTIPAGNQSGNLTATDVYAYPPMGKIGTINGQKVTLTANGKIVTVNLSSGTLVNVPVNSISIPVSAQSVKVGQTIAYDGTAASDGSVTATKIWIMSLTHQTGTVSSISGNTVVLQIKGGASITVNLNANTTYVQGGKGLRKGTVTPSSASAIKQGDSLEIFLDQKVTSGTNANAVLVVVATK